MARVRHFRSQRSAVIGLVLALTACGGDASTVDLAPAAAEGRATMRSKGCGACHGSSGGGGVGPAFIGLVGSEVRLNDGTRVIADRDYLVESIIDPSAKIVEGYTLPMPRTELTESEIDAIIGYIEALAPTQTTAAATPGATDVADLNVGASE